GALFAPWRNDYPSLVLVSSPPQLLDISSLPWSDRELVVVADDTFVDHYRAVGVEPLVRDLATDVHAMTDIEQTPAIACDVCVVGNLSDARTILGEIDRHLHERLITPAVRWARDPDLDPGELLAEAGFSDDDDHRWQRALAYEATAQRRSLAAIAIAEAGFTLRIHGSSDWLPHLAGTAAEACWHGPIEPGLPMAAAFRAAGASLNVQSHATTNAMNMRTFDIPAARGVLLSNDHPALHRAFKVGEEALTFNRIEELPDLVSDIISSPERQATIGNAGRARVERDHSWDAWWSWAEAAMRERFQA
ncbi:MAG: glycosyltransferase, partial [Phycisphaerales bacterium]|nr:glycosyltransferase [Phycisphaerales bacterium]